MELFDILEQYPWVSLPLYHFTQNTLPSFSQLFFFHSLFCGTHFNKGLYGNGEEMMWNLIDDWYSGICLDTQLIFFFDHLNNIRKSFPSMISLCAKYNPSILPMTLSIPCSCGN
jgi:hypothetical protein